MKQEFDECVLPIHSCKNSESIKTRIETITAPSSTKTLIPVRIVNPLKQGLKLSSLTYWFWKLVKSKNSESIKTRIETITAPSSTKTLIPVRIVNPLKQGLKHHYCK